MPHNRSCRAKKRAMNNHSSDKILSQRAIREQSRDDRKRLVASFKSEDYYELKMAKRRKENYEVR